MQIAGMIFQTGSKIQITVRSQTRDLT
ncbi:MAG: hypothetical protein ACLU3N_08425 [Lachnospiraceae bacterium]